MSTNDNQENTDVLAKEFAESLVINKSDSPQNASDVNNNNNNNNNNNPFVKLPIELFLHICSFLNSKTVIIQMSLVCKHFNNVIKDSLTWKQRIYKRWPNEYPPAKSEELDWKRACIEREDQYTLWTNFETTMKRISLDGQYGNIDRVHLMNKGKLCVSGSRDQSIAIWNIESAHDKILDSDSTYLLASSQHTKTLKSAHTGWIWTLDSCHSILSSGSWDKKIVLWDGNADFKEIQRLKLFSAVLCQAFRENEIIAGGFDKKVYLFDLRNSQAPREILEIHKKPVVCLQVKDNYLVTGSEDKKICVVDLRKSNECVNKIVLEHMPLCMSYKYDHLWVGEKQVQLYDASLHLFNHVETIDLGHHANITGIQYTLGALITCSKDKMLKFSEPNLHSKPFKNVEFSNELGSFHFLNNIFAIPNQASIDLFIPKEHQF